MSANADRFVAFDSHVLTYFLEGNRGVYSKTPEDPVATQRIAAVRLFVYCSPVIVPTVTTEAAAIRDRIKQEEHLRFIWGNFIEFNPDDSQVRSIERRAAELLAYHSEGPNDCRIVAEVEEDGDVPVLVTFDTVLIKHLSAHSRVSLQTPTEAWDALDIPRGTPPKWSPGPGHPLQGERWFLWE